MATTSPNPVESKTNPNAKAQPKRRMSSKTKLNLVLDITLFLAILFIIWTTAMMRLVFPPPTQADGWTLWGMSLNQWSEIQFYSLCVFTLLSFEHVVLHWKWVANMIANKMIKTKQKVDEGSLAMYAIGTCFALLFTLMAVLVAAIMTVQSPA